MSSLVNKQILLGVTGGIAAYKSAELVRRLQDAGACVRVVMTAAAQEFITPLTLQALSGNPVHTDLLDPKAEAAMGHIELARWADALLVAPASADFIAKLAGGHGSDLLSTLCLATRASIVLAPAMNQAMWGNDSTQVNLERLRERGVRCFGPAEGSQACGDVGPGRMLEAEDLAARLEGIFESGHLAGKTVAITAGPTQEAIDPVRYISNHSSGKMGYALAEAAAAAGAHTILISGPTYLPAPSRVELRQVVTAQEMYEVSLQVAPASDIFIAAAAVVDYRPISVAEQKIKKKHSDGMTLKMTETPDIVAAVASIAAKPFTVGFAAETNNVLDYAQQKLLAKNLDMIVANDVSDTSIGFNSDNNAVVVLDRDTELSFEQRSKAQLARDLMAYIARQISKA